MSAGEGKAAKARMPAVFIGHGSPMNTLADNRYTRAWRDLGASLPTPKAILVVSAHWYIGATAVTAMARPRTIHDFYGFPAELFAFQYPAAGAPDVAGEIAELVKPLWVALDQETWGLDHGTWSVLAHMYPQADVPVLQLSINGLKPLDYHVELGAMLAPLRERGVLVVASGNVVHNLRTVDMRLPDAGFDWARRFDESVREAMLESPGSLASVSGHADFARAVPTPDHFIPLLYVAGRAAQAGERPSVIVDGYSLGSLSMTAYALGTGVNDLRIGGSASAPLPDPSTHPADGTNT